MILSLLRNLDSYNIFYLYKPNPWPVLAVAQGEVKIVSGVEGGSGGGAAGPIAELTLGHGMFSLFSLCHGGRAMAGW